MKNYKYKPFKYFLTVIFITWISLFTGAYFSYNKNLESFQVLPMIPGLFSPFVIAMFMIFGSKNQELKKDFIRRIFNLNLIKLKYLFPLFFIMPFALFLSTAISLLFGQSVSQFSLSSEFAIMKGEMILSILILILAPTFEELGWRGYGVDSLKSNRNLLKSTLIFAFLWALWHLPLFFIKDYYQNELIHTNIIFAINFFVSLIPASILMNWLFYRNDRSITVIIIFHFMLNLFSVLFQTTQVTKCIITVILSIISIVVVFKNRKLFFAK